ncbi:polysaccharide deacetylase family protein [Nibrella saemangeumensis]|uniref:Polysaccharide deacetylase family protein n=1 Tax=Nibrella saemangeumensis TaxID=1084526 RepID=A0ABP8MVQ2_9BACT
MKTRIALLGFFITLAFNTYAQYNALWKGKKCAVVLTYDDALAVHLTNAIPALDSLGLKATFYIADISGDLQTQIPAWRSAAVNGHELGNHTLTHPCEGGRPGREFVRPEFDLTTYSLRRMTADIRAMNTLLYAIDGKTRRTFAYPCGDTRIGDTPYINEMKNAFIGARGVSPGITGADKVDLYNTNSFLVNGQSGEELIAQVKQAEAKQGLLVFLFHGVGGGHGLNVSLPAHRQLLRYLKQHENNIWIAPMVDVAVLVKELQTKRQN